MKHFFILSLLIIISLSLTACGSETVVETDPTPIASFSFNNSLENSVTEIDAPFTGEAEGLSYDLDRNDLEESSLLLNLIPGEYITVSGLPDTSGILELTICSWYLTSRERNMIIISQHNGGTDGAWYLGTRETGDLQFTLINESNERINLTPDQEIIYNDSEWHHLCGTYNGIGAAGSMKLYFDGELVSEQAMSGFIKSVPNLPIRIGNYVGNESWPYKGQLDDLLLYTEELSAAQIAELYNAEAL